MELVPGVSSSLAVPGLAGIPLTLRGVAGGFAVLPGHAQGGTLPDPAPYARVDTLVVLMGVGYWSRLLDFMRSTLVRNRPIDLADAHLLTVTDSPDDAVRAIQEGVKRYGLLWPKPPKRRKILKEKPL